MLNNKHILCHRGLWNKVEQQNTYHAIESAFRQGFGIETDIRDRDSNLVVSHDPSKSHNTLLLEDILDLYSNKYFESGLIGLNIKSDGISNDVNDLLNRYGIINYFTFDMSIPEMLRYKDAGLRYLTRLSEYETEPIMLDSAEGIWLDAFKTEWYDEKYIIRLLGITEKVCIVSSELHGRDYKRQWSLLKKLNNHNNIILCTDKPNEAKEYFT